MQTLAEKNAIIDGIKKKISRKKAENRDLESQIMTLHESVEDRSKIHGAKGLQMNINIVTRAAQRSQKETHREIFTRRRIVDLVKSQAQDIAILREELERLRLKTYPAFRT